MTPSEFLHAIWPSEGYYCIARPSKKFKGFEHRVFSKIKEAAAFVNQQADTSDLYFCMHTLKEPKVWNPNKLNRQTQEKGAYEVRVQTNTKESRCFFFDLDVGESTERTRKYESQADALRGLKDFCKATGLPRPLVSSSGRGLHVFWLLEDALPTDEWRIHAAKLRALANHHNLLADPMRTTDSSSVLRIPGTFNFKNNQKLPVEILISGTEVPSKDFLKRMEVSIAKDNVQCVDNVYTPTIGADLGDNLSLYKDRPPVKMESLERVCEQIRLNIAHQENLSEPAWFNTLNIVRYVEDADYHMHRISEKHPDYTKEETNEKIARLRDKDTGPTLCVTFAKHCGEEICKRCPHFGKIKSPLVAAAQIDEAKPAEFVREVNGEQETHVIPKPPMPYKRLSKGGIVLDVKDKEGNAHQEMICRYDFFPLYRVSGEDKQGESKDHSMWRVILPFEGAKDFSVPAKILYDKTQLLGFLAERSVFILPKHAELIKQYMIAYIAHLQSLEAAEKQINTLGWSDDFSYFALADKAIHTDGSVRPITLSANARAGAQYVSKKGTLEKQIELLNFFNHEFYVPNQFYIMCSLAAPFFYATLHAGAAVNASGDPGASKSTGLYTGASFWGKPTRYPLNGTNNGATTKARFEKMSVLSHLPVCVDELTHIMIKDANTMVMNVTQHEDRSRLEQSGTLQKSAERTKSTFMLTTSNNSLHSVLATDNAAATAGSMRLFEIIFKKSIVHKKPEADAFLRGLEENYGHIGEAFMLYAVPHKDLIVTRIRQKMTAVDTTANIEPAERFWSAVVACTLAITEVANELGLVPFNPAPIEKWVLSQQLAEMRGVVVEEYADPLGVLADYLSQINGDLIVMRKTAVGNKQKELPIRTPRGKLLGHYDLDTKLLWVQKTEFNNYCVKSKHNASKILKDLSQPRGLKDGKPAYVILDKHIKKVLGAGTDYHTSQVWCFLVNMDHPEVLPVSLDVIANPAPELSAPKGDLKLV